MYRFCQVKSKKQTVFALWCLLFKVSCNKSDSKICTSISFHEYWKLFSEIRDRHNVKPFPHATELHHSHYTYFTNCGNCTRGNQHGNLV